MCCLHRNIKLQSSAIKLNVGAQSNLRMEDEGGNEISLKMLLSSVMYNLKWVKQIMPGTELIFGNNFLFQNNTNYGKRIIFLLCPLLTNPIASSITSTQSALDGGRRPAGWVPCRRVRRGRQAGGKNRAFAGFACDSHIAAHHAGELATNRKAEAGFTEFRRGRESACVNSSKLGLLLRRHADAVSICELDPIAAIDHFLHPQSHLALLVTSRRCSRG